MTLVVDASAIAELLLSSEVGHRVEERIGAQHVMAPPLLSAEVLSILRGLALGGRLSDDRAQGALKDFADLGIEIVAVDDALDQAWALRHNCSAYDAMYVVLARATGSSLLTLDARLVRAAPDCAVTV